MMIIPPVVSTPLEAERGHLPLPRAAYHHGDLRNALIEAAFLLARTGGPEAVILREAARQTGVSPTSAYRHFANHAELVGEVQKRALADLAIFLKFRIDAETTDESATLATRRLRAFCTGYIAFAVAEPGLFRVAFDRHALAPVAPEEDWYNHPLGQMLTRLLDDLAVQGLLDQRREDMELNIWSTIHGFSILIVDGLLVRAPGEACLEKLDDLVDFIIRGL